MPQRACGGPEQSGSLPRPGLYTGARARRRESGLDTPPPATSPSKRRSHKPPLLSRPSQSDAPVKARMRTPAVKGWCLRCPRKSAAAQDPNLMPDLMFPGRRGLLQGTGDCRTTAQPPKFRKMRIQASRRGLDVKRSAQLIGRISLALLSYTIATQSAVLADAVPDLVGRHLSELATMPELRDVELEIQRVDSTARRGEILLQIPGANSAIGTGRLVYLKVSDGVVVPDVRGLAKPQAEEFLKESGIRFEVTQRPYEGVRNDLVAAQVPESGTRLDASRQVVFLIVSDGTIMIPDLKNLTHGEAVHRLAALGLRGRIEPPWPLPHYGLCGYQPVYSSRVTKTEPGAGAFVNPGKDVTVHYDTYVKYYIHNPCSPSGVPL